MESRACRGLKENLPGRVSRGSVVVMVSQVPVVLSGREVLQVSQGSDVLESLERRAALGFLEDLGPRDIQVLKGTLVKE